MQSDKILAISVFEASAGIYTGEESARHRSPTNTEAKTSNAAGGVFHFKRIGRGSDKIVWKPLQPLPFREGRRLVYYTPAPSAMKNTTERLKAEKIRVDEIHSQLSSKGGSEHLAIDLDEVSSDWKINGNYTLVTREAKEDLKVAIEDITLTTQTRLRLGAHFLKGLRELHSVGYAHGDIKPANALVYEEDDKLLLRICDFGKARPVGDGSRSYSGNTLYAPPEGQLSRKGDVYSAALLLIRLLEQRALSHDRPSLVQPGRKDSSESNALMGVESYVVKHTAFPAATPGSLANLWRRATKIGKLSKASLVAHEQAIHEYIDALQQTLSSDMEDKQGQVAEFCQLLREMTQSDPNARPGIEEVLDRYLILWPSS